MWKDLAACAGMDTNMFFPGDDGRKSSERNRLNRAREICRRCPVRQQCLEYAIEFDCVGLFGGMDTAERKRYAKEHDLI